jgi:hypothetical protein
MITSVLAPLIEAAFSRYEAGVAQTSIVQRAVPAASRPPLRPFDVIAIFAVGISRFPGCAQARADRRVKNRANDAGEAANGVGVGGSSRRQGRGRARK